MKENEWVKTTAAVMEGGENNRTVCVAVKPAFSQESSESGFLNFEQIVLRKKQFGRM